MGRWWGRSDSDYPFTYISTKVKTLFGLKLLLESSFQIQFLAFSL